jgi:hypothetical protein
VRALVLIFETSVGPSASELDFRLVRSRAAKAAPSISEFVLVFHSQQLNTSLSVIAPFG